MAELHRFFVPADSLVDDPVTISGEPLHHLRAVLRLGPGTEVLLLDGAGNCCRARLETVGRDRATATVIARWIEEEHPCPLRLLQALPKGDKFELVLQKGTELGVTFFQPVLSGRAVSRPETGRMPRWERIVTEAARQSRRPRLPQLAPLLPLSAALATVSEPLKLVLWEKGARPLAEALPVQPPAGVALLVGPEGGFDDDEVAVVAAAGFVPVHLGPRILRTETAGLAAAAVLQYLYGDWGQMAGGPTVGTTGG
ncbi:MAG: 16S rRNA (uracil(1498)-N(3))-methyltransferase [Desulfuromonadales bacterium]|nr:16S rRNA (uracil(1498)-N(3))-methyltransferase [Desulfuromonadales bacterium]